MEVITDQQVFDAVEDHVIDRFSNLPPDNDTPPDELERIKTDENGYFEFYVDDLEIKEKENEDGRDIWYVSATIYFEVTEGEPIEGTTDIYQAYMGDDGKWCVDWYAS